MSVRSIILSQFATVAREQNQQLAPLTDDLELLSSGLDSLSLALIVARLEDVLGRDPFNGNEAADFPLTLNDFIKLYENNGK
jgi:acyl carrier protein